LLGDVPYAVAGEHGSAIRHAPGAPVAHAPLPSLPEGWAEAAGALARAHPGALLEPKTHGVVLHYRAVPQAGPALHAGLLELLDARPGTHVLLAAKMAWELRPAGADKATAVAALMARAPFLGRIPVFVGDDVTDEDGMRAARALGGVGLRVPDVFGEPAAVRAWIAGLAACSPSPRL
jgi:trehalose 6-phosphate phosphatase